ncbi:hypothetical protein HMPREF1862_00247 [Varibaculum cambriense]|uniref:Uncharacterized protein n=1 Tax=Varibaculum cambriense TaxID=184870 RepID=A0AB34X1E8_9ACTO|nr:hypothetical protein HMPREF1862_00247 [Varibaculum cambriense]
MRGEKFPPANHPGARFFLLPKKSENVVTFSEFLCPPRLLG